MQKSKARPWRPEPTDNLADRFDGQGDHSLVVRKKSVTVAHLLEKNHVPSHDRR